MKADNNIKRNVTGLYFLWILFVQTPFSANAEEKISLSDPRIAQAIVGAPGDFPGDFSGYLKFEKEWKILLREDLKTLLSLKTERGNNLIHLLAARPGGYDKINLFLAGSDTIKENAHAIYKALTHRNQDDQIPYDVAHDYFTRLTLSSIKEKLQEDLFHTGVEKMFFGGSFGTLSTITAGIGSGIIDMDPSSLSYLAETTLLLFGAAGIGYSGKLCFEAFRNLKLSHRLKREPRILNTSPKK